MKVSLFKLYRQSLRRIRLPGLLMTGSVVLFDFLCLMRARTEVRWLELDREWYGSVDLYATDAVRLLAAPFAVLLLLFGPILMLILFHFLTKREEADFYHALPLSRPRLFFTLTAAALTYIWGALFVTFSLSALFDVFVGETLLPLSDLFCLAAWYLIGTLVTVAFAGIAVSVTGTTLSAFLVGTMLCFVFRTLSALFVGTVIALAPALPIGSGLLRFFEPSFFLPLRLLNPTLFLGCADWWCVFYNLLLAAASLALGCFLFTKRASEQATRPATSGGLQTFYRITAALPFAFYSLYRLLLYLFAADQFEYGHDRNLSLFAVFCLAAVFVYFLYELITVRKSGAFLKAVKQFPILLGVCVLAAGSCLLIRAAVLSFRPAEGEIVQVEWIEGSSDASDWRQILPFQPTPLFPRQAKFSRYEWEAMAPVTSRDPAVCEYVRQKLERTLSQDAAHRGKTFRRVCRITLKDGRTVTRLIYDLDDEFYLLRLLSCDEVNSDACLRLPDKDTVLSSHVLLVDGVNQNPAVIDAFYEEYDALSDDEKRAVKFAEFSSDMVFVLYLPYENEMIDEYSYPIPESFTKTRALIPKR